MKRFSGCSVKLWNLACVSIEMSSRPMDRGHVLAYVHIIKRSLFAGIQLQRGAHGTTSVSDDVKGSADSTRYVCSDCARCDITCAFDPMLGLSGLCFEVIRCTMCHSQYVFQPSGVGRGFVPAVLVWFLCTCVGTMCVQLCALRDTQLFCYSSTHVESRCLCTKMMRQMTGISEYTILRLRYRHMNPHLPNICTWVWHNTGFVGLSFWLVQSFEGCLCLERYAVEEWGREVDWHHLWAGCPVHVQGGEWSSSARYALSLRPHTYMRTHGSLSNCTNIQYNVGPWANYADRGHRVCLLGVMLHFELREPVPDHCVWSSWCNL